MLLTKSIVPGTCMTNASNIWMQLVGNEYRKRSPRKLAQSHRLVLISFANSNYCNNCWTLCWMMTSFTKTLTTEAGLCWNFWPIVAQTYSIWVRFSKHAGQGKSRVCASQRRPVMPERRPDVSLVSVHFFCLRHSMLAKYVH